MGIDFDRVRRGPARVRLWFGEDLVGEGVVPDVSTMISSIGMDIGRNPAGVSDAYEPPFEFAGRIEELRIDTIKALSDEEEEAAEIRLALGTQ